MKLHLYLNLWNYISAFQCNMFWKMLVNIMTLDALALWSPGHQQQWVLWHWWYWLTGSLSYMRKDLHYLCHLCFEQWQKKICFHVSLNKFSMTRVNQYVQPSLYLTFVARYRIYSYLKKMFAKYPRLKYNSFKLLFNFSTAIHPGFSVVKYLVSWMLCTNDSTAECWFTKT